MRKNRITFGSLGIFVAALCFALSLVSCKNASDAPIIVTVPATTTTTTGGESTTTTGGETTTTTGGEEDPIVNPTSGTEAPDFWTDWENMEFLSINDKGTLDTKVAAPWNRNASLTLMSEALCKDRRKRDGWEMAFSLMNQEGYPDTNYFGLYNKYLGTLRVYYYCNVDVAGSGSDFAYEILFETDTGDCKAFYNSLRYGIPLNAQVNKSADLLGGGVAQTFHLLCTPYSEIGMTTLRKGWHAFDIDLSSYSEGRHFILDGTRMKIVCKSVSNSSVSLGTDIIGKIDGDMAATIKKEAVMAKHDGVAGILSWLGGSLGDTYQSSLANLEAAICKSAVTQYRLKASSAFNVAAKVVNYITGNTEPEPDPELKLTGTFNLKIGATANTSGYITASSANNIPQVTIRANAFNQDCHIGEGVWQITDSPVIYAISGKTLATKLIPVEKHTSSYANGYTYNPMAMSGNRHPSHSGFNNEKFRVWAKDLRLPYFYDPTSFQVKINPELYPDARNIKVLTYCGTYINQKDTSANPAFRNMLGISNAAPGGCPDIITCERQAYGNACVVFELPWAAVGEENETHYYGQVIKSDTDSPYDFMVEPQIYYGFTGDKGDENDWTPGNSDPYNLSFASPNERAFGWQYSGLSQMPELYAVVCVEFESGPEGRKFVFSRVYLPEIKQVDLGTANTVVSQIEQRAASYGNIEKSSEYVASIKARLQILGQ
ncbi:MAG: hypothetical protein II610_03185 [Treponema sp.]|nr:hypothetical protein [Treponema sp.]